MSKLGPGRVSSIYMNRCEPAAAGSFIVRPLANRANIIEKSKKEVIALEIGYIVSKKGYLTHKFGYGLEGGNQRSTNSDKLRQNPTRH